MHLFIILFKDMQRQYQNTRGIKKPCSMHFISFLKL